MLDRNSRAASNTASKTRLVSQEHGSLTHRPTNGQNSGQAQSENGFYDTLRVYTQRLKQQRDNSLVYLKKVNELSETLRSKDVQISKLNKVNRQLMEKLSVYQSVLSRSRVRNSPLRMSSVVDKHKMLESIIEYGSPDNLHNETGQQISKTSRTSQGFQKHKSTQQTVQKFRPLIQQAREVKQKFQLFQQFFIVSPGDDGQIVYQYKHIDNGNKTQDCIKVYVQHPQFVLKPYQGNPIKTGNKRILFLADSPSTTLKKSIRPNIPLINDVNPSHYYFGFCVLQKELMNMNGKYFWVPMVYGFISYYPFPQHFLKTIEIVAKEFPNFKDQRKLQESLNNLNSTLNQTLKSETMLSLPADIKYTFFNRQQHFKLPSLQEIDDILLGYSKQLFKNYALELIVDVLMLLLLEIPITVISEDVQLLGKFMLYFVSSIKPLKYPFPIVFSLPPSMQVLFQSPFPTFIGCTDVTIVEKYMNERAVFDLDKKIAKSWPILQHLDQSRQYLMTLVTKNSTTVSNVSLIIKRVIDGKNIPEISGYWKDFSRTQIYQLYTCGE